jgi:hypothetical protein
MSDEIYINTGTTIQQPFNQRNPAQGTTPTTAQRTAQQPAIAQQPGTYSNRSPFTYRHPANGQQPYIANAQQPYPYIANAQNPYPANAQQPYPYIANDRQPYPYIANARQPYIANAQQPYPYIANAQTSYPANAQQPYPYIANGQQPYPYIANAQNPYPANAQQPYPYIANSQSPYSYNQPSTYSRQGTSVTNVTYTETLTAQDTLWFSGHGDNHIRFDVANVSTRSFETIDGRINFLITISTSGSNTIFNMDVRYQSHFADGFDGFVGVSGTPPSISLPINQSYRDVFQYSFPTATAPTTFGYEETDAPIFTKFPNYSTNSVSQTWQSGQGATYTISEGTTNTTVSNHTFAFGLSFIHTRAPNGGTNFSGYGEGSVAFDLKFNRSGFPELSSEEIHVMATFENEYSSSGGGGPL